MATKQDQQQATAVDTTDSATTTKEEAAEIERALNTELNVNNDLKPVLDELVEANYVWKDLGLSLGLKNGKLTQIENESQKESKRMWASIEVWMKRGGATWQKLITALEDRLVDESDTAKDIKAKIIAKAKETAAGSSGTAAATSSEDFKERRQMENTLKIKTVIVQIITCIILGCAGAGKTCLKHILFNLKLPVTRCSTNCTEKAMRVDLTGKKTELTKFRSKENKWTEIDSNELKKIIAAFLSSWKADSTSDQRQKQTPVSGKQTLTGGEQMHEGGDAAGGGPKTSLSDMIKNPKFDRAVHNIKNEIFKKLTEAADVSLTLLERSKWLYLTDSGGQPRFIDVLPFFIHSLSGAVFVTRLCDSLDKNVVAEYYRDGECVGKQPCHTTALETLKYLIQMIKTRVSCEIMPRVVIVETRKPGCVQCTIKEYFEPEDKNGKIRTMMENCNVNEMLENRNNIVHRIYINGEESVDDLLYSIQGLPISETIDKFPIWWYVYELILNEVTADSSHKILRVDQCEQIALNLGFDKDEVKKCLKFLHKHNLIYYNPEVLENTVFVDPQIPAKIVSLLVEVCYLLQSEGAKTDEGEKTRIDISNQMQKLYGLKEVNLSSSEWSDMKTEGIITVNIMTELKVFNGANRELLEQLCHLFKKLHLMVPLSTTKYFMPCLLENLFPDELEQHRKAIPQSIAEPLLLCFKEGFPHPGIFFWLVAYLRESGWKLPQDEQHNLVMMKRNCITFEANISTPCRVTLINSHSYFEIHVHKGNPVIFSELLKVIESGIGKASDHLGYGTITLERAFFCYIQHSSSTSGKNYHVGKVFQGTKLKCDNVDEPPANLELRHTRWWMDNTKGNNVVYIGSADLSAL